MAANRSQPSKPAGLEDGDQGPEWRWQEADTGEGWGHNATHLPPLPSEMMFTEDTLVSAIAYPCLFVIAAGGNLIVLITLLRSRGCKSRVNVFIMHLSIADLMVALIFIPLETTWHVTVSWDAGDLACRICMFFRAFGFYLSSFLLVTISLDRYISIVHPLASYNAKHRTRWMIGSAWGLSVVCSLPQSFIFHVEKHPTFTWFTQCVTFNAFPSSSHELAYNLFTFVMVYALPLLIIVTSYILILLQITRKTRHVTGSPSEIFRVTRKGAVRKRVMVRSSAPWKLCKAKMRTLKMTLVIVSVFILCWTPYFFILCMHWFHKEWTQQKVDQKVQRALLIFAVSNSCFDPAIYGMFTSTFRREASKWKEYLYRQCFKNRR